MTKQVLVLAYDFPPAGGGGVQRTAKFVKYLCDTEWTPIVLTVKNPLYLLRDETLCQEIPPTVQVFKTNEWLPNKLFLSLRDKLRRGSKNERNKEDGDLKEKPVSQNFMRRFVRSLAMKVSQWMMPDLHLAWVFPALFRAYRLTRSHQPQILFATSPPFSVLLTAYLLYKLCGIPYVVDFRDAWTLNPLRLNTPKGRREAFLEKRVLSAADSVVFATDIMQADYERYYPTLSGKFVTITNGYDEADFSDLIPKLLPGISIVYMGRVTPKLKLENFLIALKKIFQEEPTLRGDVRLYFVGDVYMTQKDKIDVHGLQDIGTFVGYLPHQEAIEYAAGADVLLLLGSGDLAEMTGKIFEYLRVCRPIFAVVPRESVAAKLIQQTGHGQVAQFDEIEEIKIKLSELLLDIKSGKKWQLDLNEKTKQFERGHQACQLASLFDRVTNR